jgi:hypothetical protein
VSPRRAPPTRRSRREVSSFSAHSTLSPSITRRWTSSWSTIGIDSRLASPASPGHGRGDPLHIWLRDTVRPPPRYSQRRRSLPRQRLVRPGFEPLFGV